ncbi:MAG: NAD(P)/FAD-dependent oxidoreductase [Candidatus Micrarchaeota archaeon]
MRIQTEYDAIVLGAGPGGSAFGKKAAEAGMKVLVLDKKKEIGTPVRCGEGVAEHTEADLGIKVLPNAIASKIAGARVFAPNGKSLRLKTAGTHGYVLERKLFDKHLAMDAARAGAHVLPHALAISLLKKDGKPAGAKVLHMGEEIEFHAPLIVSAEGMEAKIAREAGFDAKAVLYDVDTCFEYEMAGVPCEPFIDLYFSTRVANRGYCWVFPKGTDVANVGIGIGGNTNQNPKAQLDLFISEHPELFRRAQPVEYKGGLISVGAPISEFVKDNFMVIGTAAHQVDPIHGGGIGLAIEAGNMAAEAASEAFAKGDFSKKNLLPYEEKWRKQTGPKLAKRLLLRKVLEKLSDDDWNHIVGGINEADLDKVLAGNYKPVVAKVLLTRPTLLKVLSALM